MFGTSNPFGQPTSSPFASLAVFGQTNPSSNPLVPNTSFGSPTPFCSQMVGSMFGATSTGVFGAVQPSPFPSITTFGASSSPALGSSIPAFATSSSFGGSSGFAQNPAFGFEFTPTQSSPFGSTTQPALVVVYLVPPHPLVQLSLHSVPQAPVPLVQLGVQHLGALELHLVSNATAFGASSTPAFGRPSTPAFGASTTTSFRASSSPSFNFGSTTAFGQSTPTFGSTFGTTAVGAQSSPFGGQSSSPAFGSTIFGGQGGGSRATPYTPTTDANSGSGTQPEAKLESISAMPVYKDKSHEMRWEDYQSGYKGGSSTLGQTSANLRSKKKKKTSANPFSSTSAKPPSFNSTSFTTSTITSIPFQSTSSSLVGPTSSTTPSILSLTTATFGTGSSSPSMFSTGVAQPQATTPTFATGLNFSSSQASSVFPTSLSLAPSSNPADFDATTARQCS
ncbi:DRACULA2 [Hibiscus trionum]|uniref:DRACULA2 n=1 Tax=Hibiscus trionum TaxID=183268 RepID=A0A9W7MEN8_HIBTR|nr:DRACULA2 [Hibiscus trionum]